MAREKKKKRIEAQPAALANLISSGRRKGREGGRQRHDACPSSAAKRRPNHGAGGEGGVCVGGNGGGRNRDALDQETRVRRVK